MTKPMSKAELAGATMRLLRCLQCCWSTMHAIDGARAKCSQCSTEQESPAAEAKRLDALIAKAPRVQCARKTCRHESDKHSKLTGRCDDCGCMVMLEVEPDRDPATPTEAFDAAVQTLCRQHARDLAARDAEIAALKQQLHATRTGDAR